MTKEPRLRRGLRGGRLSQSLIQALDETFGAPVSRASEEVRSFNGEEGNPFPIPQACESDLGKWPPSAEGEPLNLRPGKPPGPEGIDNPDLLLFQEHGRHG